MSKLLIATTNQGKFEEIRDFLINNNPQIQFISLAELESYPEVVEDGSNFLENALKKAKMTASFTNLPCLADDSGLEVQALGGRPGVYSARFAGSQATDEMNNEKLRKKLEGVAASERSARFVCAMVLYAPSGHSFTAMGEVSGQILEEPRGSDGFGYDPLFLLPDLGKTMAELSLSEKNQISHRAMALVKVSGALTDFLSKA